MPRIRMQGVGTPRVAELDCEFASPRFYRIEDPMHPRASNEPKVWMTRSAGRATCPQDGSTVVTVSRDGRRVNRCLSCLSL